MNFFSLHQRTALHAAVRGDHKDIVEYLVDKKPDIINKQDKDGVSTMEEIFVFI